MTSLFLCSFQSQSISAAKFSKSVKITEGIVKNSDPTDTNVIELVNSDNNRAIPRICGKVKDNPSPITRKTIDNSPAISEEK
jgi:hypothetical protein